MSRHNIQRNWKAEQTRQRSYTAFKQLKTEEVAIDKFFWQLWKADKKAMSESGYSVKKIDGVWRAFLTR